MPVLDGPTPAWWELTAGTPEPTPVQRHVLGTGTIGYAVAVAGESGTTGAARGALVDDLLHVSRLAVREDQRRKGIASRLMAAVGAWAGERGAGRCVLQVAVHNTAALALYERLGFVEHHRYRYWVPRRGRTCEDRAS